MYSTCRIGTDVLIAELITFICLRRKSSQVTSLLALSSGLSGLSKASASIHSDSGDTELLSDTEPPQRGPGKRTVPLLKFVVDLALGRLITL